MEQPRGKSLTFQHLKCQFQLFKQFGISLTQVVRHINSMGSDAYRLARTYRQVQTEVKKVCAKPATIKHLSTQNCKQYTPKGFVLRLHQQVNKPILITLKKPYNLTI